MLGRATRLRLLGWLLVALVAAGQRVARGEQQRLVYPHLQQHTQGDFHLRQHCSPGFYRADEGPFAGRCVPCGCNGNADRCQDGTGKCIGCRYHTAGDKCERCRDGYVGDAARGSCRACPCPHGNRFATGCVANGNDIQCLCKEGYAGARCERCAPGYFGDPQKYGGYCQRCDCASHGQLAGCDRLTGECVGNEPRDVEPSEDCDSCDSCVVTLLKDLSGMGDGLLLVGAQLQQVHTSGRTLEQMRSLEARVRDLKALLSNYRSAVHSQGSEAGELEAELASLNRDISSLQEKAETSYRAAEMLFESLGQTHREGKDLVSRVQVVVSNIKALLEQVAGPSVEGNSLPSGDAARELADAQRMVAEMRSRRFGQLQAEAEKERREAQLLLARVKDELQRRRQENQGLLKAVRDSLGDYEAKITDLQEALNEATGHVEQAGSLNRDNGVLLADIKKRLEETGAQQDEVLAALGAARSALTRARSALGTLQRSKEEYESLAAQLDGARKDMNGKLTNHSLSASKEPLVARAEEHARALQELAKQLEEIKSSARKDELVSCAVEAATAYDSIIGAITAAEEAASRAGRAADSALMTVEREDLSGKAAKLRTESSALLAQAQEAERTLQALGPTLEDIKQRLDVADGRKDTLRTDLVTLQNNLSGINRGDAASIVASAKATVKSATDATTAVLDELLPIREDVERMKSTYGSARGAAFTKALAEANSSVKKLTGKLPDLFSKIQSINQQLMPTSNLSANVDHIRELIQQARDAANKVAIPMRFNGSSGVEVRLPNSLDDLRGYTSLSLFLQRPQMRLDVPQRASNKFVLYLGDKDASKDYIGMAVKEGRLTCIYNLGGGDVEVDVQPLVTQSEAEEAVMDQVKFERIYQYVRVNYVKAATSASPGPESPVTASSGSSDPLLNLDPGSVVFYVGGYPPDFRPPPKLDYPRYEGCLELDSLNERIVSLYNFKRTFRLNTTAVPPCRRYREETDQIFFEGTGYASVALKEQNTHSRVRYEQTIETTADEGIVFFAASGDQYICVLISGGHTVFRYKIGSEPPREIEATAAVNDGTYKQVHLVLARSRSTVHVSPDIRADIKVFLFSKYYLGGLPPALRERFNISTPPFRGCMKNVKNPNTASVVFEETVGVSKKCSDDWKLVRSAAFSRRGALSLSAEGFPFPKDFQVGFGFRTAAATGTLLSYNLWPNLLSIYLEPGSVSAKMGEKEIRLETQYEDGAMHYVTVTKRDDRVRLLVDDKSASVLVDSPRARALTEPIKFGGDHFEGCISNIFISRAGQLPEVENLINYTAKTGVSLGACRQDQSPEALLLKELKAPLGLRMLGVQHGEHRDPWRAAGTLSQAPPTPLSAAGGAYLLGDVPSSFVSYTCSPLASPDRFHFSAEVRTRSSRGLVVFVGEGSEGSFLALHLSKGRFVLSLGSGGKRLRIRTSLKHNDGQWHSVVFSREGQDVRLIVDGLQAQHGRLAADAPVSIRPPIYVGGQLALQSWDLPTGSFRGCLRNFKLNGEVLRALEESGVAPCRDDPTDTGIYFFAAGGHLALGHLPAGSDFRVAFSIRPRRSAGVLLHAGSRQDNYLTVYMEGGRVTAAGNSGAGGFQTSVTPKQPLSEGQWHLLAVSRKGTVVQLEVDTQRNHTAELPPSPPSRERLPLYFGRIPANLPAWRLPLETPFAGCLRGISINGKQLPARSVPEVHGAVSTQGCPRQ